LPGNGVLVKVDKSHAASRAEPDALAAAPGGTVTSRLRELIQQLGEAIHESVIESEQIAGVVQDIRRHGFDVLLMLEATIGLNEVSSKEAGPADGGDEGAQDGPFTTNDLHFLRSLRISVEGMGDEVDGERTGENEAD
jgi:uncharacterized protein (UPF0335 family)